MNILKITPEIAKEIDREFSKYLLSIDRDMNPKEINISNSLYALYTIPDLLKDFEKYKDNPLYKVSLDTQQERLTRLVGCLFKGAADLENYLISIGYKDGEPRKPKYTLDELLEGITEDNIHPAINF